MGKWNPCKRSDFIKKLKKLGFEAPEPRGRHFYNFPEVMQRPKINGKP